MRIAIARFIEKITIILLRVIINCEHEIANSYCFKKIEYPNKVFFSRQVTKFKLFSKNCLFVFRKKAIVINSIWFDPLSGARFKGQERNQRRMLDLLQKLEVTHLGGIPRARCCLTAAFCSLNACWDNRACCWWFDRFAESRGTDWCCWCCAPEL